MSNLFIRTSIAPYRIDTYNALAERLGMRMCFYSRVDNEQFYDPEWIESLCHFRPTYLKGFRFGPESRTVCRGLRKLVRQEQPDLVIIPEFQFAMWQMRWIRRFSKKKFKIVSMCDDSIDMILDENDFSRGHRWLRSFAPKKLDDIITVTPEVRDWYREHFGKGQWLPILMDARRARSYYKSLLPESAALEKKFGLEGKKVVLYVGRLIGLKNVDLLIEVFGRVADPDTVLVIVGDGGERAALEEKAKACPGRVIFTGRQLGDALYAWYPVGDVFCLLSRVEPFGAVTNEALLAGEQVLISGKAGSACLVTERNGLVADVSDPDALVAQLRTLLGRTTPRTLTELRPDRMEVSLEERMDELVNAFKS